MYYKASQQQKNQRGQVVTFKELHWSWNAQPSVKMWKHFDESQNTENEAKHISDDCLKLWPCHILVNIRTCIMKI